MVLKSKPILFFSLLSTVFFFLSTFYPHEKYLQYFFSTHSKDEFSDYKRFHSKFFKYFSKHQKVDDFLKYLIVENIQAIWRKPFQSKGSKNDITLVTQCSLNHLHHLFNITSLWSGTMSIALFIYPHQISMFLRILYKLHLCFSRIYSKIIFSLVMPFSKNIISEDANVLSSVKSCQDFKVFLKNLENSSRNYESFEYPVNLLRNTAITSSFTSHTLVIDVDMRTSEHLYENLLNFINNKPFLWRQKFALVIPVFETNSTILSKNKEELKLSITSNTSRVFYQSLCAKCHNATNTKKWLAMNSSFLEAAYEVSWQPSYEPFYLLPSSAPLYPPQFRQYGFNRLSQSCAVYMDNYRFIVVNNAFLLHLGFKEKSQFHSSKSADEKWNRNLYEEFINHLSLLYPRSKKRCLKLQLYEYQ